MMTPPVQTHREGGENDTPCTALTGEVVMTHLVQYRDNNAPCTAVTSKLTKTDSVQYILYS